MYKTLDFPTFQLFFRVFPVFIQGQKGWEGDSRERLGPHRLQSKADLLFLRDVLLWYTANLFPAAVPGSALFTHHKTWVSHRLILEGMHSYLVSCSRYYVVLQENGITEQVQTYCRVDPAILKQHGDVDKNQNSPLRLL